MYLGMWGTYLIIFASFLNVFDLKNKKNLNIMYLTLAFSGLRHTTYLQCLLRNRAMVQCGRWYREIDLYEEITNYLLEYRKITQHVSCTLFFVNTKIPNIIWFLLGSAVKGFWFKVKHYVVWTQDFSRTKIRTDRQRKAYVFKLDGKATPRWMHWILATTLGKSQQCKLLS